MKASQKELAKLLGVSRGTIDRVLHGRPNVKPETRERVLNAFQEYHYSTNTAGRLLALSSRSFPICAVLPDSPFFDDVMEGILAAEKEFSDSNLSVDVIRTTGMTETEVIRAIEENQAMAFMVAVNDSQRLQECIRRKTAEGIPVIAFNSDLHDCGRICFVGQDIYRSGRIAASLMLKMMQETEENILIAVRTRTFQSQQARIQGFIDAFSQSGKKLNIVDIIETNNEREAVCHQLLRKLTENRVDGIYFATSSIEACMEAIEKTDRKYRIVASDLSPVVRNGLKKNIIDFTIYQNPYEQGYRPVKLLFDCLCNKQMPGKEMYYTESTIFTNEMID